MTEEIQAAVARYLGGRITVDELESGLPDGWEMDEKGDREARTLVLRIIGYLSEFRNGRLPEPVLRRKLMPFAGWAETFIITASPVGGTTVRDRSTTQTFGAGTESRVVHG
jgi:hypothetical protein